MGDALPLIDLGSEPALGGPALGAPRVPTGVACGYEHTCALLLSGGVVCWGANHAGQLGDDSGGVESRGTLPGDMGASLPSVALGAGLVAVDLVAGFDHNCALLLLPAGAGAEARPLLKCWGGNYFGQLGLGDTLDRGFEPGTMGDALPALTFAPPAAGGTRSRSHSRSRAGSDIEVVQLALGGRHSCALLSWADAVASSSSSSSSSAWVSCWGHNARGQLGLGDTAIRWWSNHSGAVDLGGSPAVSLFLGSEHSCALLVGGAVKCWGSNVVGQLGLGRGVGSAVGDGPGEMGGALPPVALTTVCATCAAGQAWAAGNADPIGACVLCEPDRISATAAAAAAAAARGSAAARWPALAGSATGGATGGVLPRRSSLSPDSGRFRPEGLTSGCAACAVGRYSDQPGVRPCAACAAGRRGVAVGRSSEDAACDACAPGEASCAGSDACVVCDLGEYLRCNPPDVGGGGCAGCPAGRFGTASSDVFSMEARCEPCPAGTFKDSVGGGVGPGACTPCGLGHFSALPGATDSGACEPCGAGAFAHANASAACEPCGAGRYASTPGSSDCAPCPVGRYSGAGGSTSFADCARCADGLVADAGAAACGCPAGWLGVDVGADGGGGGGSGGGGVRCQRCPLHGVRCDAAGVRLSALPLKKGFWRPTSDSVLPLACPMRRTCLGSEPPPAAPAADAGTDGGSEPPPPPLPPLPPPPTGRCAAGSEGPLCAVCSAGFYADAAGGRCRDCGGRDGVALGLGLSLGPLLLAAAGALWCLAGRRMDDVAVGADRGLPAGRPAGQPASLLSTRPVLRGCNEPPAPRVRAGSD